MQARVFDNPDLARQILSYRGSKLPSLASINRVLLNVSQEQAQRLSTWLDKFYPYWNLSVQSLADQMDQDSADNLIHELVSYQMQRAAINGHWDALRVMTEVHKDSPDLVVDAITYAYVNNNNGLSRRMYDLYRDLIPDVGRDYSIIDYYDSLNYARSIDSIVARLQNSFETDALLPDYMIMVTPDVVKRSGITSRREDVEVLLYKRYEETEDEYSFWDEIWRSMNSRPQNRYNLANAIGDMNTPEINDERSDLLELTTKMRFFNKAALDKIKDIGATEYEYFIDYRGVSHGNPPPIVFKYLINEFTPEYCERMGGNGLAYTLIYKQFKGENINLADLL